MLPIDEKTLYTIAPKYRGARRLRQKEIMKAVGPVLAQTLKYYEVNTRLRIAHYLAQLAHESAGFRTTEEFASGEAYEGRMDLGNTEPGDGVRFKGRGLIQLTGRSNYRELGAKLRIPLEDNPFLAAEAELSLIIACEYWTSRNINAAADRDDLITVTRKINGGLNGLDDRRRYLSRAKLELARLEAEALSSVEEPVRAITRLGSQGITVIELQDALSSLGYEIAIDGHFGPATELALRQFQARSQLSKDGIAGPHTWQALSLALAALVQ